MTENNEETVKTSETTVEKPVLSDPKEEKRVDTEPVVEKETVVERTESSGDSES